MFGEHIEEYLRLEGAEELDDHSVAMGVADIVMAQGLVEEGELDLLVHNLTQQVADMRGQS